MQRTNATSLTSAMGLGGLSGAMLAQQQPASGLNVENISALEQREQDECDVNDFLVQLYDELKTHPDHAEFDTAAEGQKKRLFSKKFVGLIN